MRSRSEWVAIVLLSLLALGLVGYLGREPVRDYFVKREAKRLISRYNVALAQTVGNYDPAPLKKLAGAREVQRVTNYMGALRLENTVLEADLLSLEIRSLEAALPTVTATTVERWRYVERDRESGKQKGRVHEETQSLTYTLVKEKKGLIVSFVAYAAPTRRESP